METKTLDDQVIEMKATAELLVPYTFPNVDFKYEQDILMFKQRKITIDGFDVFVCHSKADYGDHILDSVQLESFFAPFLPFTIVCKLGRSFLGPKNLSYIEFFKNNKKVYCWTVKYKNDRILPPEKKNKVGVYEGFEFSIMLPGDVDLF